jgi:hypothetical protein
MAQQDAMEQVKEVVRQLIKYRFWISISAAALFGLIAYFVGSGPIREAAAKETANIKKAETEVKNYRDGSIPTAAYKPLVEEKTQVMTKDVNAAWKTLYDRQAPLLTWPDTVQERFQKWGRKWPENVDAGRVIVAQVDYINAYKDYVDMVYKTFKPFDYETGEGIVASPPKEVLLRPSEFSDEKVPGLGKIWSAQERLWIQRTLLEVVAQVNKNAKDWNSAIIRQIQAIEVGNPEAQDQHSLAKNEELEESEKILAPGETEEAAAPAASNSGAAGKMQGMMGGMSGGAAKTDSESVYYVKSGNASQYRILPVQMTVLIDQDHVQDLLVELENSPMSIQVKDFELQRPTARVVKPEKGTAPSQGFGMGMRGMGMGMGMGRGMLSGYGGTASQMQNQMMGMRGGMMMGGMGSPGSGAERKGTDVRAKSRADERKKEEDKLKEAKGPSLFDPYFDIVEVTVYGQARFFKPPPAEATAEPSPGQTPATGAPAAPVAAAAPAPDTKAATPAAADVTNKSGAATPAAADATNKSGAGTPAEKPATPAAGTPPKADPASDAAGKAAPSPAPAETGGAAKTGNSAPKAGDSTAKPAAGSGDASKPAATPAATPPSGSDTAKPKS